MMHRKSNPRNGMYSSGCSDAKTDRPAAEFGQTGPLSEPNGPDNQSGEPALERSNRSSRRQPAGSEDGQIVGNHAQVGVSKRLEEPDGRGCYRQHDGSTELPDQLFEHPVSDGAVPVLRQHHQPFDPVTGVGNTAIPEFDRKRTAITHYPVVGEDDRGRHLGAWLGQVGSGSLPPSGRDELSGCPLIPHLAEERGERFGWNCGGIENLNLRLRHHDTRSRHGALAENLLDEKLKVRTQPQVLITDEIGLDCDRSPTRRSIRCGHELED